MQTMVLPRISSPPSQASIKYCIPADVGATQLVNTSIASDINSCTTPGIWGKIILHPVADLHDICQPATPEIQGKPVKVVRVCRGVRQNHIG